MVGPARKPAPAPLTVATTPMPAAADESQLTPLAGSAMKPTPTPKARLQLLLVDDHTIVREGLKRILEPIADDWAITEAGTGFQALECLRSRRFDLAIVDLSMPGMSGLDLIRRIKTDTPAAAVLVLSMHAEEQYALRAFKAGADGYVTKDSAATELVVNSFGAVVNIRMSSIYLKSAFIGKCQLMDIG